MITKSRDLSKWLTKHTEINPGFKNIIRELLAFFNVHIKYIEEYEDIIHDIYLLKNEINKIQQSNYLLENDKQYIIKHKYNKLHDLIDTKKIIYSNLEESYIPFNILRNISLNSSKDTNNINIKLKNKFERSLSLVVLFRNKITTLLKLPLDLEDVIESFLGDEYKKLRSTTNWHYYFYLLSNRAKTWYDFWSLNISKKEYHKQYMLVKNIIMFKKI